MTHFMVDLETLGTESDAVVLSIGIVAFELDDAVDSVKGQLYLELTDDLEDQEKRGRSISSSTVKWWAQQSALARRVLYPNTDPNIARVTTEEALIRVTAFMDSMCGSQEPKDAATVWGNGSTFDNTILRSLYASYDMTPPWRYSRDFCYRTLKGLGYGPATKGYGVAHNALDDALKQTFHLKEIFKCLG